jgi:hypothetical protein
MLARLGDWGCSARKRSVIFILSIAYLPACSLTPERAATLKAIARQSQSIPVWAWHSLLS